MPWQRHVADVALEVDPRTGRLAYRYVTLTVPRQSGKTTLMLALILWRCLSMGPKQRVAYTAQSGSEAHQKWEDEWLTELEKTPFANTFRVRKRNGHEALIFQNGSIQRLLAGTKQSGHGSTLDLAILDEAFAHKDSRLEGAATPAMVTRPEPQLWVVSTAGTPAESPFLLTKVEAGRAFAEAGVDADTAYFEWSPEDGMDLADEATWWSCMPALGKGVIPGQTQPIEFIRSEYQKKLGENNLNEFERAYLNRWKNASSDPVIPMAAWDACAAPDMDRPKPPLVLAVDVAPDQASASIAVAGKAGAGLVGIEVMRNEPGTGWLVAECVRLRARWKPVKVVCDPLGPLGSLLADFEKAGVKLEQLDGRKHAQACGLLFDRVLAGKVRHSDQPELRTALDGAQRRTLGDAWAWGRRPSMVDISPLVACTLALWAHEQVAAVKSRVINPNEVWARAQREGRV